MPPDFVEIFLQFHDDVRELAKSYLNRMFRLDSRFLESFELENVLCSQQLPIFQRRYKSLKTLSLYNCFLPQRLNLGNLYEVHLEHCFHWSSRRRRWELAGEINGLNDREMRDFLNIQTLTIGPLTTYISPFYLPSLHMLEITVWWGHESTTFSHISTLCLENLHTLIITWPASPFYRPIPRSSPAFVPVTDPTAGLFANTKKIKVIEAPRTVLLSILLLLYEYSSPCPPPTEKPRDLILCEHLSNLRILVTGNESGKQFRDIALNYFYVFLPYWHLTYPAMRISKKQPKRAKTLAT
ncbi:hypothetical protein PIIN_06821 [Serendipita indica DSM 11827]|uniref:F-box domain-containing protein n=1 Tax=Serendipita indica (strain DSM 11827) TaxID=1109443 RepID=G4TNJ7_SERID|nr:hypothetical protein PIIN_06821 [Serendipita indica DSM 11827]